MEPTVEQVLKNYPQVTLYYRNFPLTQLHPLAEKAAEAAQCAGEQGKFWEYHDLLFENQAKFDNDVSDQDALNEIVSAAQRLNLNSSQFSTCLNSTTAREKVQADIDLGNKLGITGTPTFFIDNERLVGPQPFSAFQNLIEKQIQ